MAAALLPAASLVSPAQAQTEYWERWLGAGRLIYSHTTLQDENPFRAHDLYHFDPADDWRRKLTDVRSDVEASLYGDYGYLRPAPGPGGEHIAAPLREGSSTSAVVLDLNRRLPVLAPRHDAARDRRRRLTGRHLARVHR
jgi:hypothetical protein